MARQPLSQFRSLLHLRSAPSPTNTPQEAQDGFDKPPKYVDPWVCRNAANDLLLYLAHVPPGCGAPATPATSAPEHPGAAPNTSTSAAALYPYPCPASAARLPPHQRVAVGLLQRLCCFLADEELCVAVLECVQQAVAHKPAAARKEAAAAGGGKDQGRDDSKDSMGSDASQHAACGSTKERVLVAAKFLATRHHRNGDDRWNWLTPAVAASRGDGGSRDGSKAEAGVATPAVPVGRLGPCVELLLPGAKPRELVGALLCSLVRGGRHWHRQRGEPVQVVAWGADMLALQVVLGVTRNERAGAGSVGLVMHASVEAELLEPLRVSAGQQVSGEVSVFARELLRRCVAVQHIGASPGTHCRDPVRPCQVVGAARHATPCRCCRSYCTRCYTCSQSSRPSVRCSESPSYSPSWPYGAT